MEKVWEIKDVGESEYFLDMQVQQDLTAGTIRLSQQPYSSLKRTDACIVMHDEIM